MGDFDNRQPLNDEIPANLSDGANESASPSVFNRSRRTDSAGTGSLNVPPSSSSEDAVSDTQSLKKQPLRSPRTRPTISTSRVFSPFDLSFFEDPQTTRELSESERSRIRQRTSGTRSTSNTASHKPLQSTGYTSTIISPYGDTSSVVIPEKDPAKMPHRSPRTITPENNLFPESRTPAKAVPSRRVSSAQNTSPYSTPSRRAAHREEPADILPDNNEATITMSSKEIQEAERTGTSKRPVAYDQPVSSEQTFRTGQSAAPSAFDLNQPAASAPKRSQRILTPENNLFPEDVAAAEQAKNDIPASEKAMIIPTAQQPSVRPAPARAQRTSSNHSASRNSVSAPGRKTSVEPRKQSVLFPEQNQPAERETGELKRASVMPEVPTVTPTSPRPIETPLSSAVQEPVRKEPSRTSVDSTPSFFTSSSPRPVTSEETKIFEPESAPVKKPVQEPLRKEQPRTSSFFDSPSFNNMSSNNMRSPAAADGTKSFKPGSTPRKTSTLSIPAATDPTKTFTIPVAGTGKAEAAAVGAAGAVAASAAVNTERKTRTEEKPVKDAGTELFTSSAIPEEDQGQTQTIDFSTLKNMQELVSDELEKTVALPDPQAIKAAEVKEVLEKEEPVRKPVKKVRKSVSASTKPSSGGPNGPDSGDNGTRSPRSEKPKKPSKAISVITVLLIIGVLLELIVGATGLVIVNRMVKESPDLNLTDFVGEESTKIYDDAGELVTEVGVYLRQNITYDRCPEALVDAFLSVEDSRFFSHFGFDIPRFTKAMIENIKTRSFGQGGSTFTMQLVKNTYFSIESMNAEDTGTERTKSIEYKVQQIYLAIKLEHLLSKKEIFTLYLNKLNFGGNIRGVQRAAQYYFGKNCNELNLSEAAMLAGIVNLPNRYNPYDYLDYGTGRRNDVLWLMKSHGYITDEEYKLANAIKVEDTLVGDVRAAVEDSQYQSYIDVVLEEAMELTGADPTIKGMNIYTHLNRSMQEEVEAIQNGTTDVVFPDELMQVAMISMDNRNGAIVAVGGGRNYDGARLLNRATMNYKQPGSSVKPLLSYALAFEYLGYSLDEVLLDKPITYPMESMVLVNANGKYTGDVTIKDAVGNSLNIPAIITLERVVNKIGAQKVVDYLNTIGFTRVKPENFHLSYAIGGTTFETTCKELAGAHAMLINKGVYNQPHTIQKVVMSSDGSEYYPANQNVTALSSGSAYLSTVLEENNVSGPYFNYMQVLRRDYPVYAKTGTTDWGNDGVQYGIPKGQMKDKWMVASTSRYTNAVWVGYDKAEAGKETYYTSYKSQLNIPGNINRLLLNKEEALWGVPDAIPEPSDLESVTYLYGTFPHVRPEYSIEGGGLVTSLESRAGLESMPLATVDEFLEYTKKESERLGSDGFSAKVDQFGIVTVSFGSSICSNGQRNIGLHDPYNSIDLWGACLADLSGLVGGSGEYYGTVFCDDAPVGEFTATNGYFSGYVGDLYGEVKVCGGPANAEGTNYACTVATYVENPNANGYVDENGNWVQLEPDYSQYGYWDENGNWVGQGRWAEDGFHPEG